MIDSLFILGEDKQIIIEKHWKNIVRREVLEPFYTKLTACVNSDVIVYQVVKLFYRISLLSSKAAIMLLFQPRTTI